MTADGWTGLAAGTAVVFTTLLFARAALHKLWDFTAFTGYVADYRLVPDGLSRAAAMTALGAELLCVAALVVPGGQAAGSLLAVALLLGYAAAMGVNLLRGRDRIECGCGGAVQPLGRGLLVRNGALAAVAAVGLGGAPYALPAGAAVATLLAGATLWVGYVLVEQLLANAAYLRRRA
ncbi:MauE/DoxX family redox-associated membrane protein [Azospirillum halopraeferens]|uniref:MauE/DoxX family redox-associated membrane protein n=1 Tax=Azospirillum halopraeferens TaxID=34010 RepID=UPI0003F4D9BA|nr:MauE/DoxX family redox-associated membrane protein [Azospirillum halopraeferens]